VLLLVVVGLAGGGVYSQRLINNTIIWFGWDCVWSWDKGKFPWLIGLVVSS
jgi:hypothetical protein